MAEIETIFEAPTATERAVGKALRDECQKIFGSTWSFDNSWRLARAAIKAMAELFHGQSSHD
jgi:hypothetical protein